MHTLLDVASQVRRATPARAADGWPPGVVGKVKLRVPDHGVVTLPKHADALGPWLQVEGEALSSFLGLEERQAARAALLTEPAFLAPLPPAERITAARLDQSGWGKAQQPVHLLAAVAVQAEDQVVYGIARTLLVENLRGFGASEIVAHEEQWFEDEEKFAQALAIGIQESESLEVKPEGTAKEWASLMLVLNDEQVEKQLPAGWRRAFQLVAGLHAVRLNVHSNAWKAQNAVVHSLKRTPPAALLVADGSVAAPEVFLAPYRQVMPDGYGEVLGSAGAKDFVDQLTELDMHLRAFEALQASRKAVVRPPSTWKDGKTKIEALIGDHFVLTSRALAMLTDNPYPDPARMFAQVEALERLALTYHTRKGALGRSMEDEAISEHGIEIALFDSSLSANQVESHGHFYDATPHVKVDDNKTPDKCGRIYFAVDHRKFAFVVDHIGLHDYP